MRVVALTILALSLVSFATAESVTWNATVSGAFTGSPTITNPTGGTGSMTLAFVPPPALSDSLPVGFPLGPIAPGSSIVLNDYFTNLGRFTLAGNCTNNSGQYCTFTFNVPFTLTVQFTGPGTVPSPPSTTISGNVTGTVSRFNNSTNPATPQSFNWSLGWPGGSGAPVLFPVTNGSIPVGVVADALPWTATNTLIFPVGAPDITGSGNISGALNAGSVVPEPATLSLFGLTAALLAGVLQFRKRRQ